MKLVWTPRFTRALRRLTRRHPALSQELATTLALLERDPFHSALRTHKLKGQLRDCWACSAGYDCRLVFEIVKNPKTKESEVLLHTAGTHDEVY
jgi:addiction module RelE/StbE family toxin